MMTHGGWFRVYNGAANRDTTQKTYNIAITVVSLRPPTIVARKTIPRSVATTRAAKPKVSLVGQLVPYPLC